jgi:hypothetical protein
MIPKVVAVHVARLGAAMCLILIGMWTLNLTAYNMWAPGLHGLGSSCVYVLKALLFLAASLMAFRWAGNLIRHAERTPV